MASVTFEILKSLRIHSFLFQPSHSMSPKHNYADVVVLLEWLCLTIQSVVVGTSETRAFSC